MNTPDSPRREDENEFPRNMGLLAVLQDIKEDVDGDYFKFKGAFWAFFASLFASIARSPAEDYPEGTIGYMDQVLASGIFFMRMVYSSAGAGDQVPIQQLERFTRWYRDPVDFDHFLVQISAILNRSYIRGEASPCKNLELYLEDRQGSLVNAANLLGISRDRFMRLAGLRHAERYERRNKNPVRHIHLNLTVLLALGFLSIGSLM